MVICKIKNYAYCGDTAESAYRMMLDCDDDIGDIPSPEQMEWFTATPMRVKLALEPFPKAVKK